MTRTEAIEKINARQNAANLFTNITEADIEAEMKKEEITMKIEFTTLSGNTFTTNESGTYFYMIDTDGKKIRIRKSEFEAAQRENEIERQMSKPEDVDPNDPENAYPTEEQTAEDAQAELDKDPCFVDPMADLHKPAVLNEYGCVDCSECHVKPCVHRDCMRRNPRSEGGLAECPRLSVKVEEEEEEEVKDPELEQIKKEIPGIEDAEAELERNIRREKKAKKEKKAAKPRRSKDIAYEGHGITLTAKQVDFILHIADTDFWDGFDSSIFVDVLCDQIGGQFEGKPMTVGAMISTLCEKGLGERARDTSRQGKPIVFGFTGLGEEVAKEVGLK